MIDTTKFAKLLDNPEIRMLVYGLAHSGHDLIPVRPGAARLRAMALLLLDSVEAGQRHSWLSADAPNLPMTPVQVRTIFGEPLMAEIGAYISEESSAVAWQLSSVLPALVDAMTPAGAVMPMSDLVANVRQATAEDDRMTGAFGPHVF